MDGGNFYCKLSHQPHVYNSQRRCHSIRETHRSDTFHWPPEGIWLPQLCTRHLSSRKKWAPRAHECVFIGYDSTSRGIRSYNRQTRKVIVFKDVQFDKNFFPFFPTPSEASKPISPPEWRISEECRPESPILTLQGQDSSTPVLRSTGPKSQNQSTAQGRLSNMDSPTASSESVESSQHSDQDHEDLADQPLQAPITDFSVNIPMSRDISYKASLPLFTYQRRKRLN